MSISLNSFRYRAFCKKILAKGANAHFLQGLGVALPHSVNEVDTMAAVRATGFVHQQNAKDTLGLIWVI